MASSKQLHTNPLHDISLDEDWISLMLTDVGLDVMNEAESDARLSSFDDLPLPDMDFDWSISCNDIIDSDLMITSDDYIIDSDLTTADTHACQHDDASKHRVLPHTCQHECASKKDISMDTWEHDDALKKDMLLPTCQDDNDSKSILPHSCQRDDASKQSALPHLCQNDGDSKNSALLHLCQHDDASKKSFPSHTCQHDDTSNKNVLSNDDTSKKSVLAHDDTSKTSVLSHSCQHGAGIIFEAAMNASLSPESGVTHGSSSSACKDSDSSIHDKDSVIHDKYSSIPSMDSGSEEDDLYCFVSRICSEGSESSDLAHEITLDRENMASHSPNIGNIGKSSRKRKNLEENSGEAPPRDYEVKDGDDDEEKRRARLMRNRESAQLSRQRKKLYVDELQEKIKTMASTIAELNNTINLISNENINLRRQLSMFGPPASGQAGGIPGLPPWMGTYHPNPMMGGNFMVPNSQVPLVAIPRWKSNTTLDHSKESKPKKVSTEKASKRTRKAAGITAMGFLFFVFILFPVNLNMWLFKPNIREETNTWSTHIDTGKTLVRAGGRVLTGISESHVSRIFDEHDSNWKLAENGKDSQARKVQPPKVEDVSTNGSSYLMNGSVPLAATLFVPRHDGLVRIEGNLIIHSVLASNEATIEKKNKTVSMPIPLHDKGLALDANLKAVALKAAPEEKGALVELQRALAKKTRLDFEESGLQSLQEDGSFPQWFVEDLSGPVFSSGMCTEVFQFEMSPSSATSSQRTNVEDDRLQTKRKLEEQGPREASGRSFLHSRKSASYAVPLPPVGHKAIFKGGSKERNVTNGKDGYSSIVVSVLAESEFGEQAKSMAGGKGPSTIFIVVLIDNVKYITYSCKLPSVASTPQYEVVVA